MKTEDEDAQLEERCLALGDAIAQGLPPPPDGAAGPLPERLELAATVRRCPASRWRPPSRR
jgi:hypothetical protein